MFKRSVLALLFTLCLLSSCGTPSYTASPPPNQKPDSVKIKAFSTGNPLPSMIFTYQSATVVNNLFKTIYNLPTDTQTVCPADAGPEYQIDFRAQNNVISTIRIEQSGCHYAIISDNDKRATSPDFFKMLQKLINDRKQALQPTEVATFNYASTNQPATYALITQDTTKLYQSLLNQSQTQSTERCGTSNNYYQLQFKQGEEYVEALAHQDTCQAAGFKFDGLPSQNTAFWQLFTPLLTTAKFAPTQPDSVRMTKTDKQGTILTQKLLTAPTLAADTYTNITSLTQTSSCSRNDVGEYHLTFIKEGAILLHSAIYQHNCEKITFSFDPQPSSPTAYSDRQPNSAFWTLLKQIEQA